MGLLGSFAEHGSRTRSSASMLRWRSGRNAFVASAPLLCSGCNGVFWGTLACLRDRGHLSRHGLLEPQQHRQRRSVDALYASTSTTHPDAATARPSSARSGFRTSDDLSPGRTSRPCARLRGDSVIDWHRLNFEDARGDRRVPARAGVPSRRARRPRAHEGRQERGDQLPAPSLRVPDPEAGRAGSTRRSCSSSRRARGHRQLCACTILKVMHIIHHLDGRELLFMLPMSDQEVFHLVEEKVYRVIGSMLARRLPDHRVHRRPEEQGLALHEAAVEARDRSPRRSTTSCASASSRAAPDDIFPIAPVPDAASSSRSTT